MSLCFLLAVRTPPVLLLPLLLLLPLQDLNFTAVVAPKADTVFNELCDSLKPHYMGTNAPLSATLSIDEGASEADAGALGRLATVLEPLQKYVARAALLLWLWFDQQCEGMAEQVI